LRKVSAIAAVHLSNVRLATTNVPSNEIRDVGAGIVLGDLPWNCRWRCVGPDSATHRRWPPYRICTHSDRSRFRRRLDCAVLRPTTQVRNMPGEPVAGGLIRLPGSSIEARGSGAAQTTAVPGLRGKDLAERQPNQRMKPTAVSSCDNVRGWTAAAYAPSVSQTL
jgi:hypothetical protein